MLTFFPAPYENELWYGIITRYHIRSGNTCWKYTVQELFPEMKGYPRLGDTMPNTTMQIIAAQLPENVLPLRNCALQHSLFSFRMRFQPLEKKGEYLQEFLDGKNVQPKFLFTTKKNGAEMPLRFCPECVAEDAKQYGEPYWHTEHQIASLPLCPKHLCWLVPLPQQNTMPIGQQLILPPEEPPDADFAATETEYALTDALHYMYSLFHLSGLGPAGAAPALWPFDYYTASIEKTQCTVAILLQKLRHTQRICLYINLGVKCFMPWLFSHVR